MPDYERREFSAVAPEVELDGDITSGSTSITVDDGTGYPTGADGPFFLQIEGEDILAQSRSTNTFDVTGGRGANGTTAAAHTSNTKVNHVHTIRDSDEANLAVEQTIGQVDGIGQLLISTGTAEFAKLDASGNAKIPIGNGTTLAMQSISGAFSLSNAGVATLVASVVRDIVYPIGGMRLTAEATIDAAVEFICDGTTKSRATYASLYAALGGAASPWGQGNGTTTFNLPDFADRAIAGSGAGSGLTPRAVGDKYGVETVTLTGAQSGIAAHNHTQDAHTHVQNAHTHTQDAHTHIQNSHQHAVTGAGGGGATVALAGALNDGTLFPTSAATPTNQNTTATNQNTTAVNQNATATNQAVAAADAASSHTNLPPTNTAKVCIRHT